MTPASSHPTPLAAALPPVSFEDRTGIVDALYRFGAGQDLADEALFRSAFTEDAELDFVQPARRLGVELPVFRRRDVIAASILPVVARLDTTHTITNPRVQVQGDHALLFALVEAMHLPKQDASRHLLLKNLYWLQVVRDGSSWRARHMRINNVWMQGDAGVLFPR
jgi:hypothetical protein